MSIITEVTLSKMDVAALRQADTVVFFHNACRKENGDRSSFLKAIKRIPRTEDNPFAEDVNYFVDVDRSHVKFWGENSHLMEQDSVVGVESVDEWQSEWRTMRAFLKVGDKLELHWTSSNNNERNREINWHRDELRLMVVRGAKTHTFLVDVYVGPDNTARMITAMGRVYR